MDGNEFDSKNIQTSAKVVETCQPKIEIIDTPPLSEEYLQYRTQVWEETEQKWSQAGKEIFNGTLYRYMGKGENKIILSLMTYADRLVRSKIPVQEIAEKFGEEYVMKNCCVDLIPVTTDGKVVVGVKKRSVDLEEGKLGFIGGNMNEDEVHVNSFEDIYTMMIKEMGEESKIIPEREKMSYARLGISDGWASFYFVYDLGIHSDNIKDIFKEGEFTEFIAMTPEEIRNTDKKGIGDFNLTKDWIEDVV